MYPLLILLIAGYFIKSNCQWGDDPDETKVPRFAIDYGEQLRDYLDKQIHYAIIKDTYFNTSFAEGHIVLTPTDTGFVEVSYKGFKKEKPGSKIIRVTYDLQGILIIYGFYAYMDRIGDVSGTSTAFFEEQSIDLRITRDNSSTSGFFVCTTFFSLKFTKKVMNRFEVKETTITSDTYNKDALLVINTLVGKMLKEFYDETTKDLENAGLMGFDDKEHTMRKRETENPCLIE